MTHEDALATVINILGIERVVSDEMTTLGDLATN